MRCTMTSLSMVEAKIDPSASSAPRSSTALVMLPLCASAMCPPRKRTKTGCALSMVLVPAVE